MKEEIKLPARARTEKGTKAVNRLRKSGYLPAVIYGLDAPKSVALPMAAFETMQRHHTSESVMVTLDVEGDKAHQVLVREVQHHPLTGKPVHVDFYELSLTKSVRIALPLELTGTPVGVSRDGGVLEHLLREIEVECLPGDIIEQLELDVSALVIGDGLSVEDLPLDREKYHVITGKDIAVVSVAAPRVEAATEEEEAEAAKLAGPEVIGEKKDEAEDDK
jgi:large subunit ribosomal protein L25